MGKDLFSSRYFVSLIFLAVVPTFTLIPSSSHVLILCVFASIQRKTEIMYRRVWEKVRENIEITCQTAMCDFEKASIN
ncbi:hypothetical protein HZS_2234 [Henneguya salminicola]|nr:hypothetical protein HZS_2234 [Henneguya salminicola]